MSYLEIHLNSPELHAESESDLGRLSFEVEKHYQMLFEGGYATDWDLPMPVLAIKPRHSPLKISPMSDIPPGPGIMLYFKGMAHELAEKCIDVSAVAIGVFGYAVPHDAMQNEEGVRPIISLGIIGMNLYGEVRATGYPLREDYGRLYLGEAEEAHTANAVLLAEFFTHYTTRMDIELSWSHRMQWLIGPYAN